MTRKNIFIGLAVIMVSMTVLTGCSAEETDEQIVMTTSKPIILKAQMQTTRTINDLQNTDLSTAVTVGVFGLSDENTLLTNGDNAAYTTDGSGNLSTTGSAMNWPASASVNIYAYAPRQSAWSYGAEKTFTVATDQSCDEGYLASDLLYASQTATSQTSAVNLGFSHMLARLALTVTADASTTLTDATVKIVGTKPSTVLTLTDGTINEATGTAQDITIGSGINITAGQSQTLYAVVVPQTIAANATLIEVTAGSKVWKYHFTDAKTLAGGKSHSLTVSVSISKVTSTISGEASEPAN